MISNTSYPTKYIKHYKKLKNNNKMNKLFTILVLCLVMMSLTITKSQAQCEEVSYSFYTGPGTDITFIGTTTIPIVSWSWSVCNTSLCYGANGQTALFEQFVVTDTIKACLTATGNSFICNFPCDSLVWSGDGWEVMVPGVTGIEEIMSKKIVDYRMFDLLGREFKTYMDIPIGTIYIQNKRKSIKIN